MNSKGGFTLIELLVVIAIIGILSSVVLVSLNSARSKGKDGRVQEETNQIKTWLEANNNGTVYNDVSVAAAGYSSAATTSATAGLTTLLGDIYTLEGTYPVIYVNSTATGSSTIGTYSVYSKLSNGYFCLSSGGNSVTKTDGSAIPVTPGATNTGICI